MSAAAEALVSFSGTADPTALEVLSKRSGIRFEARNGRVRILAESAGSGIEAMTAASLAALALIDALKDSSAAIESVRLQGAESAANPTPGRNFVSQGYLDKDKPRPKPKALMGEVSAPAAPPDDHRDAFRRFMTSHRLRPTTWAKDAGIATGEIMGYLTGRSRGLSGDVAEKLARAAKVRVEDMFK
jgi:hypothetical protein